MRISARQRLPERQHHILDFLVRDYITYGRPVASEHLHRHADLQVSPATIRNELSQLAEEDFLAQPHLSGGRIPTEQAYRYFVDHCLEIAVVPKQQPRQTARIPAEHLARRLAERLPLLVTVRTSGKTPQIIAQGVARLFSEIARENRASILGSIGYLLDHLEEVIAVYQNVSPTLGIVEVFIGSENPIPELDAFSVFHSQDHRHNFTLVSVAPMRTDYEHAFKTITALIAAL